MYLNQITVFRLVYDGDDTAGGGNNNPPPKQEPTFTQKQLNEMLAKQKREFQTELQALKTELDETGSVKSVLEKKLEEIETANMTEMQLSKREIEKLSKQLKETAEQSKRETEFWKGNYTTDRIENNILKASTAADAVNNQQILDILQPKARLVEITENGKGTGKFEVKIPWTTIEDGEPVTGLHTPDAVIGFMKENVEQYGNLFKATMKQGTGGNNVNKPGNNKKPYTMSQAEYAAWRKENLKGKT